MAGESLRQAGTIYVRAFRRAYDNLGMLVFISITWFLLSFVPAFFFGVFAYTGFHVITLAIWLAVVILLSGPVTAALYAGTYQMIRGSLPSLKEFWGYFRAHFKVAAGVTGLSLGVLFVLAMDLLWFWQHPSTFIRVLGFIWVQLIFYQALTLMYVFPFMAHKAAGVMKNVKKAALMALDNFIVSVAVLLLSLVIFYISVVARVPLIVMLAGFVMILHTTAHQQLMRKYEDELPMAD